MGGKQYKRSASMRIIILSLLIILAPSIYSICETELSIGPVTDFIAPTSKIQIDLTNSGCGTIYDLSMDVVIIEPRIKDYSWLKEKQNEIIQIGPKKIELLKPGENRLVKYSFNLDKQIIESLSERTEVYFVFYNQNGISEFIKRKIALDDTNIKGIITLSTLGLEKQGNYGLGLLVILFGTIMIVIYLITWRLVIKKNKKTK